MRYRCIGGALFEDAGDDSIARFSALSPMAPRWFFDDLSIAPPPRGVALQLDSSLPPRPVYALLMHRFD
jgi:hypothetical protein